MTDPFTDRFGEGEQPSKVEPALDSSAMKSPRTRVVVLAAVCAIAVIGIIGYSLVQVLPRRLVPVFAFLAVFGYVLTSLILLINGVFHLGAGRKTRARLLMKISIGMVVLPIVAATSVILFVIFD